MFIEPRLSSILSKVEALKHVANHRKIPLAQLAIAWVLRRPEVTSAIVGARRPAQIEETAPAADVELPETDLQAIENILGQARV